MMKIEKVSGTIILFFIALFDITAFGLLAFREGVMDTTCLLMGLIAAVALLLQYNILTRLFGGIDKYVIMIVNLLVAVGLVVIYVIQPKLAFTQLIYYALGTAVMIGMMLITMKIENLNGNKWRYIIIGVSLGLMVLVFVLGKEEFGAKNWLRIAGFSIQPSELVKIVLVVLLASYFANEQGLLRQLPVLAFCAICMVMLLMQRDLGAVLLYFGTTLIVYYVCTNNVFLTLLGVGGGAAGAVVAYRLFGHVRNRVALWQDPWSRYYTTFGAQQIVQGLIAIAAGGLFGTGVGLGYASDPAILPVSYSDYIFAVLTEEFGLIVGMLILAFYIVLILRGAIIGRYAKTKFHMILAFGCTTMISLQGFIIIAGVIKMIPLTGITLPFISYGGSSLLTCMAMIGILLGVSVSSARARKGLEPTPKMAGSAVQKEGGAR